MQQEHQEGTELIIRYATASQVPLLYYRRVCELVLVLWGASAPSKALCMCVRANSCHSKPAQPTRLVQFLKVHWRLVGKIIVSLCHQAHRHRKVHDAEECWVCNLAAAVRRSELLLWVAGSA